MVNDDDVPDDISDMLDLVQRDDASSSSDDDSSYGMPDLEPRGDDISSSSSEDLDNEFDAYTDSDDESFDEPAYPPPPEDQNLAAFVDAEDVVLGMRPQLNGLNLAPRDFVVQAANVAEAFNQAPVDEAIPNGDEDRGDIPDDRGAIDAGPEEVFYDPDPLKVIESTPPVFDPGGYTIIIIMFLIQKPIKHLWILIILNLSHLQWTLTIGWRVRKLKLRNMS